MIINNYLKLAYNSNSCVKANQCQLSIIHIKNVAMFRKDFKDTMFRKDFVTIPANTSTLFDIEIDKPELDGSS